MSILLDRNSFWNILIIVSIKTLPSSNTPSSNASNNSLPLFFFSSPSALSYSFFIFTNLCMIRVIIFSSLFACVFTSVPWGSLNKSRVVPWGSLDKSGFVLWSSLNKSSIVGSCIQKTILKAKNNSLIFFIFILNYTIKVFFVNMLIY